MVGVTEWAAKSTSAINCMLNPTLSLLFSKNNAMIKQYIQYIYVPWSLSLQSLLIPCFCTSVLYNWIVEETSCFWLFIYLDTHLIKNISPKGNVSWSVLEWSLTHTHVVELSDSSRGLFGEGSFEVWLLQAHKSKVYSTQNRIKPASLLNCVQHERSACQSCTW